MVWRSSRVVMRRRGPREARGRHVAPAVSDGSVRTPVPLCNGETLPPRPGRVRDVRARSGHARRPPGKGPSMTNASRIVTLALVGTGATAVGYGLLRPSRSYQPPT